MPYEVWGPTQDYSQSLQRFPPFPVFTDPLSKKQLCYSSNASCYGVGDTTIISSPLLESKASSEITLKT